MLVQEMVEGGLGLREREKLQTASRVVHSRLAGFLKGALRGKLACILHATASLTFGQASMSFLTNIVLTRMLGVGNYGAYALVVSWVSLLAIPAAGGFDRLSVRETAIYAAKGQWPLMSGLFRWSNRITLIVSVLVGAITAAVGWLVLRTSSTSLAWAFCIGMVLVPVAALTQLRQGLLIGLHKVVQGQLSEKLIQPLFFLALLLPGFMLGRKTGTVAVIVLRIMSGVVAYLAGLWMLARHCPQEVRQTPPLYDTSNWLASVWPLTCIGIVRALQRQGSIVLLGIFASTDQVGLFSVSNRIAQILVLSLSSFNMALAPSVAKLYAMNERTELQRLLTKSACIIALVCVPLLLGVILLREHLLSIFGSKFTAAAPTLAILCAGQIVNATTGNTGILMNMAGHDRETLLATIVSVALSALVGLLLIPTLGALGAATSTSLALAGMNLWLTYRAIKLVGIDPSILRVMKK